jgi:murein DD-endopeptidase MepM/ murein hydrolase activator NlpD
MYKTVLKILIGLSMMLLIGCNQPVVKPDSATQLDYDVETQLPDWAIVPNIITPQDAGAPYLLPWPDGQAFRVTQGYNSAYSHANTRAVDFGLRSGTEVRAARAGVVKRSVNGVGNTYPSCFNPGFIGSYNGNFVEVLHDDGTRAIYLHLTTASVALETRVAQGQPIGISGNTGCSDGPHVHFQVYGAGSGVTVDAPFVEVPGGIPQGGATYTSQNRGGGVVTGDCNATYPSPPNGRGPGDPNGPVSITPAPGQPVVLSWQCVNGATGGYGVYVSKEPYGGANLVVDQDYVPGTSYTIPAGVLQPGVKYRWNMLSFQGTNYDPAQFSNTLYFQYNPQTPTPKWTVDPTSMTFTGVVGATPATQPFKITNTGDGAGTFGPSSTNDPLLTASGFNTSVAAGGSTTGNAIIGACTAVGTSTAELRFESNGSRATIAVTRVCNAAPVLSPAWSLSGNAIAMDAAFVGAGAGSKPINVTNIGQGAGTFTASVTGPFVLSETSAALGVGAVKALTVTAQSCSGRGAQSGVFTVSGGGATPLSIPVSRQCQQATWQVPSSNITMPAGQVGAPAVGFNLNLQNTGDTATYQITSSNPAITVAPASGTGAANTNLEISGAACTSAGTVSSNFSVTGGGANPLAFTVSRVCNPITTTGPAVPTGLSVNMSSLGKILVSWNEPSGATKYRFKARFAGDFIDVTGEPVSKGGASVGGVATWTTSPEAADKQNKEVCLQVSSVNAAGQQSGFSGFVCTNYRYYTSGIQIQSSGIEPILRLGK